MRGSVGVCRLLRGVIDGWIGMGGRCVLLLEPSYNSTTFGVRAFTDLENTSPARSSRLGGLLVCEAIADLL